MISNAVIDCIHSRRSTRRFQDRQIEKEQLEALLDAAIWAPSGGNNQSWLFTAIQNKSILAKINGLLREGFEHWIPDDDYPGKQRSQGVRAKRRRPLFPPCPNAHHCIQ